MIDKSTFLQSYSRLMVRTWASDEYFEYVVENPREALSGYGIEVPETGHVSVVLLEPTGEGSIDDQIEAWERGEESGQYDLLLAKKPDDFDINDMALSDNELDVIAGGVQQAEEMAPIAGGCSSCDYCCCCTPCTCCT